MPRGPGAAGAAGAAADGWPTPVVYHLDDADRLTWVSESFGAAALADETPSLRHGVVGSSLWAHVTGDATRRLYEAVHAAVRASGEARVLPFRCDAPAERRWMELLVWPLVGAPAGALEIVSRCLYREARPPVALLAATQARDGRRVRVCSLCRRALVFLPTPPTGAPQATRAVTGTRAAAAARPGASAWVEPDAPEVGWWRRSAGTRPGVATEPRVVHTVCPHCRTLQRAVAASRRG